MDRSLNLLRVSADLVKKMPLYDCMLLLKPHITRPDVMDLVSRVGKHIYQKNGVLTELKSMGTVQLGYGIKKLDGRHYQGQLLQMTMMAPPSMNKELHYLNKEDRLLRWLMVKHRDVKIGLDYLQEDTGKMELSKFRSRLFDNEDKDMDFDDDEDDDDDEEYNVDQIQLDD
ncbi:Mitochondrial ribosomal protein MRP17 [Heracleum sosnowskyi]|uniref:Mitochondrial ribosomal protein MRP17 n=1 Tax=Heracleum sosnowskyi TaxID=360622 RepID=A0AAD8J2M5_9APIA|nr:Mitochondrial ribosomal protein MRP17 [Heracleum sosnowskyi]